MEFERLAGRPCTQAEAELAARLTQGKAHASSEAAGCSVWAEGLLPEALAHLALALTLGEELSVLFVSPSLDLLEHRQLRLGTRGPCRLLRESKRETAATCALTVWATPDRLESAHLARLFGSRGPDVIMMEDAQTFSSASYAFRPSFRQVRDIVQRFPQAQVVAATLGRENTLRTFIGKALGIQSMAAKKGERCAIVVERSSGGSEGPRLHVERDQQAAVRAIIGPLPRPALVLCSTPAQADQIYAELESAQVPVHRVHSGLPAAERAKELVHFALPGRRAVMIAVSSFGPSSGLAGGEADSIPEGFGHGYSRQDLRSIVHLCAPCSLDQYAKELAMLAPPHSSRSASYAVMLYDPAHLALNLALLERKRPSSDLVNGIVSVLLRAASSAPIERTRLEQETSSSAQRLGSALAFLKDMKVLDYSPTDVRVLVSAAELKKAALHLSKSLQELADGDADRLQEVEAYALAEECRGLVLSRLLGREGIDCGVCDVCNPRDIALLGAVDSNAAVNRKGAVDVEANAEDEAVAHPGGRVVHVPALEQRGSRRLPARQAGSDPFFEPEEFLVEDLDEASSV